MRSSCEETMKEVKQRCTGSPRSTLDRQHFADKASARDTIKPLPPTKRFKSVESLTTAMYR
jgi:hypothetical protein